MIARSYAKAPPLPPEPQLVNMMSTYASSSSRYRTASTPTVPGGKLPCASSQLAKSPMPMVPSMTSWTVAPKTHWVPVGEEKKL